MRVSGFGGFGVWGFRGLGVSGFGGLEVSGFVGFGGFGVQGFRGLGLEVSGFGGFGGLGVFGVSGFGGFRGLGFGGLGVSGFGGFRGLGVWGFGVYRECSRGSGCRVCRCKGFGCFKGCQGCMGLYDKLWVKAVRVQLGFVLEPNEGNSVKLGSKTLCERGSRYAGPYGGMGKTR